jgi:xylulokinase
LEAVAFILRGNLELLEEMDVAVKELRCLGGAAQSDLWLQIKADVCRKNLTVMQCQEAACLGVAMLSAVGTGVYANLADARQRMVQTGRRVYVDPRQATVYDEVYRHYQSFYQNIEHIY